MRGLIRRSAARIDPVVVGAGLAAALPVIVSTVRAVRAGWLPVADDAMIVVRSLDVLSTHSPLLGAYSASSSVVGQPVSSPGPMLFWLLALPVRAGHAAPAIAMGLVNTASVVGVVALAKRRGGLVLMFVVAGAVALMCRSLQAQTFHDVWNPSAAVLPFALLVFLAWSVAAGEQALLPLMVVVGSFSVQAQLTFALPVLAAVAVGLGFLVASGRRVPRRTVVVAAVALLACWSLPFAEQAVRRPGNLVLIGRVAASDVHKFGWEAGWHSVEHAVGVPPWWVRPERDELARLADVGFAPGALMTVSAIAVLAVLALPALDLYLGQQDNRAMPESTDARRASDGMTAGFGAGSNGPLLLSVDLSKQPAKADQKQIDKINSGEQDDKDKAKQQAQKQEQQLAGQL
ncbi:MAG TPA: hypothetical protein VJT75_02180, partial [Thermoleophilaceae bacterium]|nr:hypothetical protein [Thermoleophilaceae bacterium]